MTLIGPRQKRLLYKPIFILEDFGVDILVLNCLEIHGILQIRDLLAKSRLELISIAELGEYRVKSIIAALRDLGFTKE